MRDDRAGGAAFRHLDRRRVIDHDRLSVSGASNGWTRTAPSYQVVCRRAAVQRFAIEGTSLEPVVERQHLVLARFGPPQRDQLDAVLLDHRVVEVG